MKIELETRKIANLTTMEAPRKKNTIPEAEPVPNWDEARKLWGIAWEIHWIGFGVAFSILALLSFSALLQAKKKKGFGRKPFVIAVNSLLLILGVTRATYLLIDPYGSQQNGIEIPWWFLQFLFNIAFPCLTSSFSLIFLVFLEVAKFQLVPKKLQNTCLLVSIILLHFAVVLAADIASAVNANIVILLIICQLFFIVWGLLLSAGFIYSGLKVIYQVKNIEKRLDMQHKTNTSKVAKVTIGTSVLGLVSTALQLYSLVSVYRFYGDFEEPEPWMWWIFQTCSRLVETAMACTITYSVRKPSERNNSANASRKLTVTTNSQEERTGMENEL